MTKSPFIPTFLLLLLNVVPTASGGNLFWENPDFAGGVGLPWHTVESFPAKIDFDIADKEYRIEILNPGSNRWDVQLRNRNFELKQGWTYTVKFTVRSSHNVSIYAKIGDQSGPAWIEDWNMNQNWEFISLQANQPRTVTQTFTANRTVKTVEMAFHLGGGNVPAGTRYWFSNISLTSPQFVEPVPPPPAPPRDIRVNQVGYYPGSAKKATLVTDSQVPVPWELRNSAGAVVMTGNSRVFGFDRDSGEHVHLIDLSGYDTVGQGYRLFSGAASSFPFSIGNDIYRKAKYDALKYFYHNRSATAVVMPYAVSQEWVRPAGHLNDVASYAAGAYTLNVTGGWYDAGDYGKYVVNGGISVWTMMNQYERTRHVPGSDSGPYADGKLNIPESGNGIADILDESRFQMEFMLKMQIPPGRPLAGMAHHKIHDEFWTGLALAPHESTTEKRVLKAPSTAATLNLAATAAQAYRIWKDIDTAFAGKCLTAAETAWDAAVANPARFAPFNDNVGGGPYGDDYVLDEFYWAGAELYLSTGKAKYRNHIQASVHYLEMPSRLFGGEQNGLAGAFDWGNTAGLGTLSLATVPNGLSSNEIQTARNNIKAAADYWINLQAAQGYGISIDQASVMAGMDLQGYPWGSNSFVLNQAMVMAYAYDFSQNRKYLDAMTEAVDYIMGRNPLLQCYVTGFGSKPLLNPHHRFYANQVDPSYPKVPPGFVSGGPNSALQDPWVKGSGWKPGSRPPQKCFMDHIESWSTNEVTINWNAPFAWVMGYLDEVAPAGAADAPLTFTFDDGLQGWTELTGANTNVGPRNFALSPPAFPGDTQGGAGAVGQNIQGGTQDSSHPTLRLRSPEFKLTGTGNLTAWLKGGSGSGTLAGTAVAALPSGSSSPGFQGIALRNAGSGQYVLAAVKPSSGDTWEQVSLSAAQLADLDQNANYTLDLVDAGHGGWGWVAMDSVTIPGELSGGGTSPPPAISGIADQTIAMGASTGALAFTVGSAQTAAASLTVSGASSNTTLVPAANIVFGGSGANRTVTVTPAAGQSGSATITLTVSDGALTAGTSFTLTVTSSGGDNGSSGFLKTAGNRIVDAQTGVPVRLNGINWFGLETQNFALHGLWQRSMNSFLDQMQGLGYNLLRIPFSNEMLKPGISPNSINYYENPDLQGLSPIQLLDTLIARAGQRGMRIMLDRHRPTSAGQSQLWYNAEVSEERWIADWVMLANRYRGNPVVIGADLHNEPHGPASWGTNNLATDWRLAAERCGNAILDANPDWLIVVGGIESHEGSSYWWGGNLKGVRQHPVRLNVPNRLVYSPHDYGPGVFEQAWFKSPDFPNNLPAIWTEFWAYIHKENIAPILVGEFGGRRTDTASTEGVWQNALVDFIAGHRMYWTYWSWNPNSGDTGGVLLDDWSTIDQSKQGMLDRLINLSPSEPFELLQYGFDDGTLQGWTLVSTDGQGRQFFALVPPPLNSPNSTPQAGSHFIGLHIPAFTQTAPAYTQDGAHDTLLLRSPEFTLNGAGGLSAWLCGGGNGSPSLAGTAVSALPASSSTGGFRGIALRNVTTGQFVLSASKTANANSWEQLGFTADQLAALPQNQVYTLDFIDAAQGSWGWVNMDSVSIPGNPAATADPFVTWAGGKGLSGSAAAFDADPDGDGIANGLEFVLGGEPNPANPGSSSLALLPTAEASGDNLVFTFSRDKQATYLNPTVEFSADLVPPWTTAVHGSNATITATDAGDFETVTVTIPKNGAATLFARLKVVESAP